MSAAKLLRKLTSFDSSMLLKVGNNDMPHRVCACSDRNLVLKYIL